MAHDKPTPIRFGEELLDRADRVAEVLTTRAAGVKVTRSDVIRLALGRGLDALESELTIGAKKKRK